MKILKTAALAAGVMLIIGACGKENAPLLTSPDGNIGVQLTANGGVDSNALTYTVTFNNGSIVSDSPLGLELLSGENLATGLKITGVTIGNADETYTMPYGITSDIRNHYNEAVYQLENQQGIKLELVFRAFNDGVAFRYRFPEQANLTDFEITGELSSFAFISDYDYWGLHLPGYTTSYESDYTAAKLANIKPDSLTALPLLVKVSDEAWVGITEANIENYAGMYLRGDADVPYRLVASLSPQRDNPDVCVTATAPLETPWRVMIIGDAPGRLYESNIVLNLNDPAEGDFSWVKPGKSAWDWWNGQVVANGQRGQMDNATMKYFIDFAGEMGLEYMLVDAGWYVRFGNVSDSVADGDITQTIPEIDMPELVRYAAEKNVGIVIWLNWIPVARDMEKAFPVFEQWGVKGIKIDFMDSDDQFMVGFYNRVAELAARHHLVVDFHGAYKPDGIRRTYPNVITREGVMGLEYVKWSNRITPDHDATLPFTRMLAGPMDYTPGGFTNTVRDGFRPRNFMPMTQGTRTHQLALFVIFESPFQVMADFPDNYRGGAGIEFLRHVPTTWDETHVLDTAVGDYTFFARRNGEEWYLGGINDWAPREFDIPLDFIGDGNYVAEIFSDGPEAGTTNAEDVTITSAIVTSGTTLHVAFAPGGGYAVRMYPATAESMGIAPYGE